jgi:hexosaminidase
MNFIRIRLILAITALLFACKEPVPRPVIRIIPLPAEVTEKEGVFIITPLTKIEIGIESIQMRRLAGILTNHISKYFGINNLAITSETGNKKPLSFRLDENLNIGKEGYYLSVTSDSVVIEASSPNGLFYGIQTLIQLMPPSPKLSDGIVLPAVEIKDSPRFIWRGLHLDASRHFMPKKFILRYLDYMAMHKLNTFHWHLADDQGWRIEIKKYPRLTEVGSVRKATITGHVNNPAGKDTIPYGGFYSQNDIREIVSYASDRFITVVPGIEMPGHALAALAAYPELGCTGVPYEVATRWGTFSDVYCPGKEGTFRFLRDVLDEVASLFPGSYLHFGGAQCPEIRWGKCPQCQLRMKNDSLNSTADLYNYFVRRITNTLDSLEKERVVWDELINNTLDYKGVVMCWHGAEEGIASAQRKLQTVMSPAKYCNFDQYQANPKSEPLAVGGLLTLEQVYNYDPVPVGLSNQEAKYIIGAQANTWTQYMKTPEYVEYMTFPRAAALAEVVWTPRAGRNYQGFRKRLLEQIKRYDAEGIIYCKTDIKPSTE